MKKYYYKSKYGKSNVLVVIASKNAVGDFISTNGIRYSPDELICVVDGRYPKYTFSNQVGIPGHCYVAQVFGLNGELLVAVEPTNNPFEANHLAERICDMLNGE